MEKKIKVIFTHGSNLGKTQNYLIIPDEIEINQFRIKGEVSVGFRKISFDNLKFKKGMYPGAVFEMIQKAEDSFSWNKNSIPLARWDSVTELSEWEALHKSDQRAVQNLKEISKNEISFILEPIKQAYRKSSYQQKELILAQVIRAITS